MKLPWPFRGRPVAPLPQVPEVADVWVHNVRFYTGTEPVLADVHVLTSMGRIVVHDVGLNPTAKPPRLLSPWVPRRGAPRLTEEKHSSGYIEAVELPVLIRRQVADELLEAWNKR